MEELAIINTDICEGISEQEVGLEEIHQERTLSEDTDTIFDGASEIAEAVHLLVDGCRKVFSRLGGVANKAQRVYRNVKGSGKGSARQE